MCQRYIWNYEPLQLLLWQCCSSPLASSAAVCWRRNNVSSATEASRKEISWRTALTMIINPLSWHRCRRSSKRSFYFNKVAWGDQWTMTCVWSCHVVVVWVGGGRVTRVRGSDLAVSDLCKSGNLGWILYIVASWYMIYVYIWSHIMYVHFTCKDQMNMHIA